MSNTIYINILIASSLIKAILGPKRLLYSGSIFNLEVVLYKLLAVKIFIYIVLKRDRGG